MKMPTVYNGRCWAADVRAMVEESQMQARLDAERITWVLEQVERLVAERDELRAKLAPSDTAELHRALAQIGVVGQVNGRDVVYRLSMLEILTRRQR